MSKNFASIVKKVCQWFQQPKGTLVHPFACTVLQHNWPSRLFHLSAPTLLPGQPCVIRVTSYHHIKIWQTCDRHLFDMSGVLLIGLKDILANSSVAVAGEGELLTGESSTVAVRSFLRVALFGRCGPLVQDCTQSVSCGKCCSWWCLRKILTPTLAQARTHPQSHNNLN